MMSRGGNGEKKHKKIVGNDEQRWEWREDDGETGIERWNTSKKMKMMI